MIEMSGTLTVKAINGRNGQFMVGEIQTSVGDFKVKDKVLEQFEPGAYPGRFIVERIFPECRIWGGQVITEVRAKLADVMLDADDPEPAAPVVDAEPDPADEEARIGSPTAALIELAPRASMTVVDADPPADTSPAPVAGDAVELATEVAGSSDASASEAAPVAEDRWVELFGAEIAAAIAAGDPVKLDPSVDRKLFRDQRLALGKELLYAFKASSQTWYRS